MGRIEKLTEDNKQIFVIDYSDCKEAEMIALVLELKKQMLSTNRPVMILSIFSAKSYATPKFMREAESSTREVIHLIEKSAMVGLSKTKKMILKGFNFLLKRNFKAFDTKEEAMVYLLDVNTSDKNGH